jgi:hypothetical protein
MILAQIADSMCGNHLISQTVSPDSRYRAVVFVRDCGATTGFSTQVSILKEGREFQDDDLGNVLVTSDKYYGAYSNNYGSAEIKIYWTSNNKILIKIDQTALIGNPANEFHDISIDYEYLDGAQLPTTMHK